MVSLGGSITLNPKTSNPKTKSNLPIFLSKPWELDSSFHVKTYPIFSLKKKKKSIPIQVLLVGSHMGENFKTNFQLNFHPKWE
jgi:hypothetical protein